jgi:DNA repair protein RecO (recombination protein O)
MSVLVEDDAVLLRSHRYGDTSRIVVFLTGRFGKIHGIAKGARNPRSGFGSALEILAESHLVFYLKPDRDLQLLRKGSLLDGHDPLLRNAVRYHYGCAAVEFADKLIYGEGEAQEPAALLRQILRLLEDADVGRLPAVFKVYQLRFASILGYRPHLSGCIRCHESGAVVRSMRFGMREGGLLCSRHQSGAGEMISLTPEAASVLRRLTESPTPSDLGTWAEPLDSLLERVVEGFLRYHIDGYRGLRSLRSLRDLLILGQSRRLAGRA